MIAYESDGPVATVGFSCRERKCILLAAAHSLYHELREAPVGEVTVDRGERHLGQLVTCSRPIHFTGIIRSGTDIMPEEKLRFVHGPDDAAAGTIGGDHD